MYSDTGGCCFLSFTGCAAHSGPEADIPQAMEQLLLERGYPAALIDGLIPQQLERLYTLVRGKRLSLLRRPSGCSTSL